MKVLLITANVGSIFEYADKLLVPWCKRVLELIDQVKPQFCAIHCQEIGGKNYEQTMEHLQAFVGQILGSPIITERYPKTCVMCDGAFESQGNFTALGNMYFVSKKAPPAEMWDFQTNSFEAFNTSQIDLGDIEALPRKLKEKFPPEYFPGDKWSRKGFFMTRWRFGGQLGTAYDFVNIHLFHDDSNLVALKVSPSLYSKCRKHALDFTLGRIEHYNREYLKSVPLSQGDGVVPYILFGDFNFRLDTHELVKKLTSEQGEQGSGPFVLEVVPTDLSADGQPPSTPDQSVDDFEPGAGCILAEPTEVGEIAHPANFELRSYDTELKPFQDRLFEYPINFSPSYPYTENVDEPPSAFMKTRWPAWCDRILLSTSVKPFVAEPKKAADSVTYQVIGKNAHMGDHKPVYLSIDLK